MKCLTWNIEWATAKSKRGKRIREIVQDTDPDLICFTEATMGMIPDIGHVATCGLIHAQVDGIIPKRSSTDQRLSDHVGIIASIRG